MANPGIYDILLVQGDSFDRVFTVTGFDLTGYSASMQVRPNAKSDTVYASATCTVNGTTDTITVTIDESVTADIPAGYWAYDLELTTATSTWTILSGKFQVLGEVTRPVGN